jgi:hypothetical protein
MNRNPSGKSVGFVWGLAAGLLVTFGLVVVNDLQGGFLPGPATASAEMTRPGAAVPVDGRTLRLAGPIPGDLNVLVDGQPVETRRDDAGLSLTAGLDARSISLRSPLGIVWTARIGAADTLAPALGGELVVEVLRQGPTGELWIDGEPVGAAPSAVDHVPAGWHRISVRRGGEVLYEESVEILPDEVSVVRVPPAPPKGKGSLAVRSRVIDDTGFAASAGDAVLVDGAEAGVTPVDLALDAGFHSVTVRREGYPDEVQVLYLPAGQTRHVEGTFGREDVLDVAVSPPTAIRADGPAAIAVKVARLGESVDLVEGRLHVVRAGQQEPVSLPLAPSAADPKTWVAVLPPDLLLPGTVLRGYAECTDRVGHAGVSEIFSLPVN